MITVREITKKEQELLLEHYKNSNCTLIRERAHAILLSTQERSAPEIAQSLFRAEQTIREWIEHFNTNGISSIFHQYENNENAAKLTKEQKKEVAEVLQKPPSDYDLPGALWMLPAFKSYITAHFGVTYESDRSYHYLLKYCRYSWKLPSPFDIRRDDDFVEKRMEEIKKEVRKYEKDPNYAVFYQDESRINWEEDVRRAWLKTNEKTVIKLSRKKMGQSYFGALNTQTKKHHLIELEWQDTENMIMALGKLSELYPHKKLCILWDNARWHKSKVLREELKKEGKLSHVHLINFPPYAPDENPEEHVWKEGKEKLANRNFESFETLKNSFRELVDGQIFDYGI